MTIKPPHPNSSTVTVNQLRVGMVGMGMIFDETYRPFLEAVHRQPLYCPNFGVCRVSLSAIGSRTGRRAEAFLAATADWLPPAHNFVEPNCIGQLLESNVDVVCVATPDNRHFEAARAALTAGKHLLVEKPSVLSLQQLDELQKLADQHGVLAKVVYHKLLDPDHKKLRTLVHDAQLQHVNNGYCSLLEPKIISGDQFSEWISGRNPGTYVAVHYIKLIDFLFPGRLRSVACTGQRGIVAERDSDTWDSTQLRLVYEYDDGREAAFDIHTSWVTPDNFPGYVEQEVQFRFDNGVWNGHSRRRGVECTIEGQTPISAKISLNNHYSGSFIEPWGDRSTRGYGVEVIDRFMREVATVEFGGPAQERSQRLAAAKSLTYNDVSADRQVVAAVQSMEAILERHANGQPDCVVHVNQNGRGLTLFAPGSNEPEVLYSDKV